MKLFTAKHKNKLLANGRASHARADFDPWPVVKLFTPWANCTWLVTEIDPGEPNRLWVLADLGLDCCEYGTVWLTELLELRGPAGLRVERDRHWTPQGPISAYIRASGGTRLVERLPINGVNDNDIAEWVGLHYGRDFDTEPDSRKAEWRERYAANHASKDEGGTA